MDSTTTSTCASHANGAVGRVSVSRNSRVMLISVPRMCDSSLRRFRLGEGL